MKTAFAKGLAKLELMRQNHEEEVKGFEMLAEEIKTEVKYLIKNKKKESARKMHVRYVRVLEMLKKKEEKLEKFYRFYYDYIDKYYEEMLDEVFSRKN